jgi:hypothetical protein
LWAKRERTQMIATHDFDDKCGGNQKDIHQIE